MAIRKPGADGKSAVDHDQVAFELLERMERGELAGISTPRTKKRPETIIVLDEDGLEGLRDIPGHIMLDTEDFDRNRPKRKEPPMVYGRDSEKPYGCKDCDYNGKTKSNLREHIRYKHTSTRSYSCEYCDYTTMYHVRFRAHLESRHFEENPFVCGKHCDKRFPKYFLLREHRAMSDKENIYVCNTCQYHCNNKQRLAVHMRIHDGSRTFECDVCEYSCTTRAELRKHILTTHGNFPFRCHYCDFKSSRRGALKVHMVKHTGVKPYACSQCGHRFTDGTRLKVHVMMVHTNERPFACDSCGYRTARRDHLKLHVMTHRQERPYACTLCSFRSVAKCKLKEHMRAHTGVKPYECGYCEYRASRKDYLDSHMRQHTGAPTKPRASRQSQHRQRRQSSGLPTRLEIQAPQEEQYFICELCDYRVYTQNELDAHMKRHASKRPAASVPDKVIEEPLPSLLLEDSNDGDDQFGDIIFMSDSEADALDVLAQAARAAEDSGPYPAEPVEKRSKAPNVIVVATDSGAMPVIVPEPHTQQISASPFACGQCSFRSGTRSGLNEHLASAHSDSDPNALFACEVCQFRCNTRTRLKAHMSTQHPSTVPIIPLDLVTTCEDGKKIYCCDFCKYTTAHRQAVRRHKRTHTGEKPYGCVMCEFRSTTMRRMKEHVMVHMGHKPFKCDTCAYSTARKDHLKVHKLTHTQQKRFQCEYCDFKTLTNEKLTLHRRSHTGEKPYACDYCEYRAARKDYLKSHMRQHTGAPTKSRSRKP